MFMFVIVYGNWSQLISKYGSTNGQRILPIWNIGIEDIKKICICLQYIRSWLWFLRKRLANIRLEAITTKTTTVKTSWHSSLRCFWVPVTAPEALPTLRTCKVPVFFWSLSSICLVCVRDFVSILLVYFRDPVPEFYPTSLGAPDWTENTFYLNSLMGMCYSTFSWCYYLWSNWWPLSSDMGHWEQLRYTDW